MYVLLNFRFFGWSIKLNLFAVFRESLLFETHFVFFFQRFLKFCQGFPCTESLGWLLKFPVCFFLSFVRRSVWNSFTFLFSLWRSYFISILHLILCFYFVFQGYARMLYFRSPTTKKEGEFSKKIYKFYRTLVIHWSLGCFLLESLTQFSAIVSFLFNSSITPDML